MLGFNCFCWSRDYEVFPESLEPEPFVLPSSMPEWPPEHVQAEEVLNWSARLQIAQGSTRGLAYLHHDCCPAIVHRDIKSSNILLDENLEPHVSDFSLAELLVDEDAHVTTVVARTFGYLALGISNCRL